MKQKLLVWVYALLSCGAFEGLAQDYAPDDILSVTLNYNITSATYEDDIGAGTIHATESNFSAGIYQYTKISSTVGRVSYTAGGYSGNITLTFSTPNSGAFRDDYSGPYTGSNTGTFQISEWKTVFTQENWYEDAEQLADGWQYLEWFDRFQTTTDSWIYHSKLGWLFDSGHSGDGFYFRDAVMNQWLWTDSSVYPWVFLYGNHSGWFFFFEEGRPGQRNFLSGTDNHVYSERALVHFNEIDEETELRIMGPIGMLILNIPNKQSLSYSVESQSPIVSATGQWVSGGKIIKTEDLATLSSRPSCSPVSHRQVVCLQSYLLETEAIGPSTLTITVENADGETATIQSGEYWPNAGPFNGTWSGQIVQNSDCGDDDVEGFTIEIIQAGSSKVAIYGILAGNNWVSGDLSNGVITSRGYSSNTHSGIPIRVTELEATQFGTDLIVGTATFTSGSDALTSCSGIFTFHATRQ